MKETDILLVGFGFSAVPLLRELDLSGVNYTIISEKDGSIWASLARSGGLDFDLVSSYYTSFYTFDLVDDFSQDRYPTAREFYDMHLRYYRKYQDRIIVDRVTLIENKTDHSIVHTKSGDRFKAKHVVISTAFRRRMNDAVANFDCSIRNKTVVIDSIGDSANLLISKLVTGDNRIICLQNGFLPLDKLFYIGDTTYSLDQLEAHQTARSFPRLYGAVINFNFVPMTKIFPNFKPIAAYMALVRWIQHVLGRIFTPENFHVRFADTRRGIEADRPPKAHVPNGIIAIKYWPIDTYVRQFSEELPERIRQGFLLNDLVYFVSEGLVTLWGKDKTKVDEVGKTVEYNGESIHYDYLIQGDAEVPRLPQITYEKAGQTVDYEYVYRENYLGVIPSVLSNVYLLGYTRPLTGGLSNITEMQSLLIHRMLTDEPFRSGITDRLDEKIEVYNRRYYVSLTPGPRDHLTYYGFYTDEVARELGISPSLKSCRSFRDVAKYLCYPNNADKFRQTGPYKIDKCAEFVDHVFTPTQRIQVRVAAGLRVSGISAADRRRRGYPSSCTDGSTATRWGRRRISVALRVLGHDSRHQQLPILRREVLIVLVVHTDAVSPSVRAADLPDRFPRDVRPATTSGSALPVQRSQEQEEVPRVLRAVQRGLQSRAAAGSAPIGRWQLA